MKGNAMLFFALLETTVAGKTSPKMQTKKQKEFFAFYLLLAC